MPKPSSQQPANVPLTIHQGKVELSRYPTPNLADRIHVRRMDARAVKNKIPPIPGSAYDGPDPAQLEGFVFATARPADQGGFIDWFYLNERANQDAYNFAIEYPWVSKDYPRITRTYVFLRSSAPVPDPAETDPADALLSLVAYQEARSDDPIIDSLFVGVTKVFERLPAPTDFVIQRDDSVLPYGLRNLVPSIATTEFQEGPATAADVVIATNEEVWGIVAKTISAFKKQITTIKRALPYGGVILHGFKLTRDQQLAEETQTWNVGPQTIVPRATLVDASVVDLGNNTTLKEELEVESVFPATSLAVEIPDAIPPEFRLLSPTRTSGVTEEGQVSQPVLAAGEIAKSEVQQTEFIKRTQITDHDLTLLPQTLTDKATSGVYGFGGVLDTARTLDEGSQNIEQGIRVVSSSVRDLGNGLTLKETTKLPGDGGATLQLDNGGSGYSSPPTVVFDNTNALGEQGAATAVMATADNGLGLDRGGTYDVSGLVTPGDDNGAFYKLGTLIGGGTWTNPVYNGSIAQLSFKSEIAGQTVGNDRTSFMTNRTLDSFGTLVVNPVGGNGGILPTLTIDLGAGRKVDPVALTIRRDSVAVSGGPEDFSFFGSNDGSNFILLTSKTITNTPGAWDTLYPSSGTAYRFFRIQRTNNNDFSNFAILLIQEIELYGTLTITPTKTLAHVYDGDNKGVFYFLGQLGNPSGVWRNPQTNGDVSITAPFNTFAYGNAASIVDRKASNTYLNSQDHTTLYFDLGTGRKLGLKTISYRQRADYDSSCVSLGWQGSNNGSTWSSAAFIMAVSGAQNQWTTADLGNNPISATAYRYFRFLIPTGSDFLSIGEIEFYGDLYLPIVDPGAVKLVVSGVTITDGGDYLTVPTVVFGGVDDGGGTTQATGTAVLTQGELTSIVVKTHGSGYTSAPDIALTGGIGSGASATAYLGKSIASITVNTGGSGYQAPPAVAIASTTLFDVVGGGAVATAMLGKAVASVQVLTPGSGYTSNPSVAIVGTTGSGATGTAVRGFGVASVSVTAPGTGYDRPPSIIFTGTGTGARGHVVFGQSLSSPTITAPGSGFTSAPDVVFSGGGGSGATGVVVRGFALDTVDVDDGGLFFTSAPSVSFAGGGGSGATATAKLEVGMTSINLTAPGSGYTTDPVISFTGGGSGTGATATATRSLGVASIAVDTGGSGYTTAPTVAITGDGTGATATAVLTADAVTSITVDDPGTGYTTPPTISFTGDGTGAAATASLDAAGPIKAITLTNPGTGYTATPTVVITGDGTGGTATAVVSATGKIASITVTNGGLDYSSAPTVALTGGGGTGAEFTVNLAAAGRVTGITITAAGTGYTSAPAIVIGGVDAGGGSGATAISNLGGSSTTISAVVIDDPGSGYTTAPTVTFRTDPGGSGSGATGTAVLGTSGTLKSITLTAPGSGFETSPRVNITGGGGTGATAQTTLSAAGGSVSRIVVTHSGEKYTSVPAVTLVPPPSGGSGATATAVLSSTGPVVAVVLTVDGVYIQTPLVSFSGGGGTGAAATYLLGSESGWPVLYQTVVDETTGIAVLLKKELVDAGTKYSGTGYEEIQPIDKWRSIRITSVVDLSTIPIPEVFAGWTDYSFPPELLSIGAVFNTETVTKQGPQNYDGTFQSGSNSSEVSGGAVVNIRGGYHGPCRSETMRTHMLTPPTADNLPEPKCIHESSGTILVSGSTSDSSYQDRPKSAGSVGEANPIDFNLSSSAKVGSNTKIIPIGPFLTGFYVISNATTAGGGLTVSLPPSEPLFFTAGESFVVAVRVTKQRFGIWEVEVVRLYVPSCGQSAVVVGS